MTAYVIFNAEVTDPEQYARYREKSGPALLAGGGEFIVRGGERDLLEGELPLGRTVIARFPSMEAARAWYDGELYREAMKLREGAAITNVYIVDGVD